MKIGTITILASTLFIFNACCTPQVITKYKYIQCVYPEIVDLNYTNDTNYTLDKITFKLIEDNNLSCEKSIKEKEVDDINITFTANSFKPLVQKNILACEGNCTTELNTTK